MSEAVRDVCGASGVPEQLTEEKVTRGNSDRLAASFENTRLNMGHVYRRPFFLIQQGNACDNGVSEASP